MYASVCLTTYETHNIITTSFRRCHYDVEAISKRHSYYEVCLLGNAHCVHSYDLIYPKYWDALNVTHYHTCQKISQLILVTDDVHKTAELESNSSVFAHDSVRCLAYQYAVRW